MDAYRAQNEASTHCGKSAVTSNGRNSNAKGSARSGRSTPLHTVRCTGPRRPRREGDRASRDFDISSREQRRARQRTQTCQIRTVHGSPRFRLSASTHNVNISCNSKPQSDPVDWDAATPRAARTDSPAAKIAVSATSGTKDCRSDAACPFKTLATNLGPPNNPHDQLMPVDIRGVILCGYLYVIDLMIEIEIRLQSTISQLACFNFCWSTATLFLNFLNKKATSISFSMTSGTLGRPQGLA